MRSLALTIPAVTVEFRPNGLPNASTQSPTCTPSELPSFATGRFVAGVNLDHREIGVFVDADHARVVVARIAVEAHLNLGGVVDHVVVREDEALLIDDHARTQAALGVRRVIGRIEEAVEEILEWVAAVITTAAAWRGLAALAFGFSITCVVEMLTTAGPRFFEMLANAPDRLIGSGIGKHRRAIRALRVIGERVAGNHGSDQIPMPSVATTRRVANTLRRRAQLQSS